MDNRRHALVLGLLPVGFLALLVVAPVVRLGVEAWSGASVQLFACSSDHTTRQRR